MGRHVSSRHTIMLLVGAATVATACSRNILQHTPGLDDAMAMVPWFANMHTDISVKPYNAAPRMPVPGTIPITGGDVVLPLNLAQTPQNVAELGRMLPNPVPTTAASVTLGWLTSALSTSIVERRWPLTLMTSSTRPRIQK